MWVFKEHSLTGEKTPAENPPKEGFGTGVDSFVLIIRVCVSWESLPEQTVGVARVLGKREEADNDESC